MNTYEKTIPVLDGYVKYICHMGDDLLPLVAARMSTGNPTGADVAKDDRLRDRLWREKHHSPFEFGALVIEVQGLILSRAQIFRHRVFTVNEHSGRYAEMPDLFFTPAPADIRSQSKTNHQMSGGALESGGACEAAELIHQANREAHATYRRLLELGVAREQARCVLPLGQYTRWMMQGNPRAWLGFFSLRLASDVQPETRMIAEAAAEIFRDIWPKTWATYDKWR